MSVTMQKILNDPHQFTDESLDGILLAHSDVFRRVATRALARADAPVPGKVAIVTGGGFGHLPLFLGYVGRGLADGVAVGDVFTAPSFEDVLEVTRAVHGAAGVLYLYGNYTGDVMNFDMAAEIAISEGIEVKTCVAADDVASAPPERRSDRRGTAGIFLLYKVAGAAAAAGADLAAVTEIAQRAAGNLRSMGLALSPCTLPAAGRPTFTIEPGQMAVGMGIHGEPGIWSGPLKTADAIAEELSHRLMAELPSGAGDRVAVLINGLGGTPLEELYILYRRVHGLLDDAGLSVCRAFVGEYATSLEMGGASISLLQADKELERLLNAAVDSPLVTA